MSAPRPLVTLGLPVRNGAAMLPSALDSVLAQDYPNTEIIVSDNASDDNTSEILHQYVARHPNLRVIRQKVPLPAFDNFLFLLREAKGEYFVWCAHDDTRSHDFVSCLLTAFAESETVLAFGDLYVWDGHGLPSLRADYDFANVGLPAWQRLRKAAHMQCYHIYGLWRTDVLRSIRYHRSYWWPDMPILLAATTRGLFRYVGGPRFVYYEVAKSDAERAAYQDYRRHLSSAHGLAALLASTWKTLSQSAGIYFAILGTLFILEKYARYLPFYIFGRLVRQIATWKAALKS